MYAVFSWLNTRSNEKHVRNELHSFASFDKMGFKDASPQLLDALFSDLFSLFTVKLFLLDG